MTGLVSLNKEHRKKIDKKATVKATTPIKIESAHFFLLLLKEKDLIEGGKGSRDKS